MVMDLVIKSPKEISDKTLEKIVTLVNLGGQVKINLNSLKRSELIAYYADQDEVVCTLTIKNPHNNYKTGVFTLAKTKSSSKVYSKELGYISTANGYGDQKLCQKLLKK
jgi:hypothetical protein